MVVSFIAAKSDRLEKYTDLPGNLSSSTNRLLKAGLPVPKSRFLALEKRLLKGAHKSPFARKNTKLTESRKPLAQ